MNSYQLTIRGENFLITADDRRAKFGFYTTVFVKSDDPTTAENTAIEQLRNDEGLVELTLNAEDDSPLLFCEEIYELEEFPEQSNHGKIWFEENPRRWWQFWRWFESTHNA